MSSHLPGKSSTPLLITLSLSDEKYERAKVPMWRVMVLDDAGHGIETMRPHGIALFARLSISFMFKPRTEVLSKEKHA